ncbi:DUF2065 domain-containing protein [Pelagovum sp. HNIBRBA483]|uniref:DUF2065 domain-containing protein n=1 Tax=Pelagovum sp. HNIBRBA483 TaxID=3233341 RepID=UPI0034A2D1B3
MTEALYALGLVLIVEGLVYVLAPHVIEDLLRLLRDMPAEARRLTGLIALTIGLALVWYARMVAAG